MRRSGRGHWLTVQLRGDPGRKCPRDAIGSVVFVTAGGVASAAKSRAAAARRLSRISRVHFGLGAATEVTSLEVRWANGPAVRYTVPRIDAIITIDQASGAVTVIAGCSAVLQSCGPAESCGPADLRELRNCGTEALRHCITAYSSASASIGEMRAARCAGRRHAASATMVMTSSVP